MPTPALANEWSPFYETECPARPLYNVDKWRIVQCEKSGLVYLANPLLGEALSEFYSLHYFEGDPDRKGYASYDLDEPILRANFRDHVHSMLRVLREAGKDPSKLSLLDYGCAYGYFLAEAKAHMGRAWGIELSEDVAEKGRAKFGLEIHSGGDLSSIEGEGVLDVLTMWDVIEHLPTPRTSLAEARRLLRPGGHLFITTGNIDSLLARTLGHRWRLINPPQHICYFSIRTLSNLLRENGFEVVSVRTHGKRVSLAFIGFILSYLLGRKAGAPSPDSWLMRRSVYVNLFDVMNIAARRID